MRNISYRAIFRHFARNKTITTIKIAGLAIGICISLVVFLAVSYEFSFDRKHGGGDRIFRVVSKFGEEPNIMHLPGVPMPMPSVLKSEVAGIQLVAPILLTGGDLRITVPANGGDRVFEHQSQIIYTDPGYFQMFRYRWLQGDPAKALSEAYKAVLTRSAAKHYFPGTTSNNLIGKTIVIRDTILLTVSGIVDDPAQRTDLNFRMFVSLATAKTQRLKSPLTDNWVATIPSSQVYVKLEENADPAKMQSQLDKLYMRYGYVEVPGFKPRPPFRLQPLSDIHFNNLYFPYFGNPQANKTMLYGLALVAGFMLVLGIINFVTLTTAQGEQRAKEVGIRRTIGGSKNAIFCQFFAEAIIIAMFALILAVALVPFALMLYREYLPEKLSFGMLLNFEASIFTATVFVVVAFCSGIYTALRMTRINVIEKIRGSSIASNTGSITWVRKVLVLVQFVISQVFIIGTVFVGMQLRYTSEKDRGFRTDGVICFWMTPADTAASKRELLREDLLRVPGVTRVSFSNAPMASKPEWAAKIGFHDGNSPVNMEVQCKYVDSNFLSLYQVSLKIGRNLSTINAMDECLINETMARSLGYTQLNQLIGKRIDFGEKKVTISGITSDFHFQSLHIPIKPLMVLSDPQNLRVVNVALADNVLHSEKSLKAAGAGIAQSARSHGAKAEFEFQFQDEVIDKFYADDRKISFLLRSFTIITVIVSCIGLFGLSIYSTQRRQKEISIRKVLGASVPQIIRLFTKEFVILVAIAFLIAVPLTYVFVQNWLNDFSYRIPMSWWI
ncbi:MAG: ABC transporter permease, partial [Flavitalea sp.]